MNKKQISLVLAVALLTACGGGSSSSKNDGKGDIDLSQYYPNKSMTKTFIETSKDGDNVNKSHYDEIITVTGNTITTTINTEVSEKVVFSDTNITTTSFDAEEGNDVSTMYRYVDLGDTLYSHNTIMTENNDLGKTTIDLAHVCKLKSKETEFTKGDNVYKGDLLKIECISEGKIIFDVKKAILDAGAATDLNGSHNIYDTSYFYIQKDLGEVASVNDDCITNAKLPMVVNDKAKTKDCVIEKYDYGFYIP